jgi:hypothetical protein
MMRRKSPLNLEELSYILNLIRELTPEQIFQEQEHGHLAKLKELSQNIYQREKDT